MRVDLYLHSCKENAIHAGQQAGLTEDQLDNFMYAGTEHKATYEVDEQGNATLVAVDDRELT
jgi:hypothetical protein